MLIFVVILLILAAAFGILGAVLKAVAFLVITALLTVTLLAALAWWGVKRSARKLTDEYDRQISQQRVTKFQANEADPGSLPHDRDDRY
jgi:peptidoglycan/LPS O-acetylase OafA/YrhL